MSWNFLCSYFPPLGRCDVWKDTCNWIKEIEPVWDGLFMYVRVLCLRESGLGQPDKKTELCSGIDCFCMWLRRSNFPIKRDSYIWHLFSAMWAFCTWVSIFSDFFDFATKICISYYFCASLTEPKGQLLIIDGKTEDEVSRSLERVLLTTRITETEPKVWFFFLKHDLLQYFPTIKFILLIFELIHHIAFSNDLMFYIHPNFIAIIFCRTYTNSFVYHLMYSALFYLIVFLVLSPLHLY